jgi:hypothetical protein
LCANIGALSGDVVKVEIGVLSRSESRKGRDESEVGKEHVGLLKFDLLEVKVVSLKWLKIVERAGYCCD